MTMTKAQSAFPFFSGLKRNVYPPRWCYNCIFVCIGCRGAYDLPSNVVFPQLFRAVVLTISFPFKKLYVNGVDQGQMVGIRVPDYDGVSNSIILYVLSFLLCFPAHYRCHFERCVYPNTT
jgi:hypothetical protein